MCVISGCESLYVPPSKTNIGLFQIIELILMGVCGILSGMSLFEAFRKNESNSLNEYSILCIVADVFIVAGLCLVLWGLFCGTSGQVRSGIICFVVGSIIFAVYLVLAILGDKGANIYTIVNLVVLIFISYILWIQAGKL